MYNKTRIFLIVCSLFLLVSCGTVAPSYNYKELAKASIALGIDIDYDDNHQLYVEASKWIGTPYRYGGNSRAGVDCSGLVCAVYKKVYKKDLKRSADEQYRKDCIHISKRNLREGDLVFFKGSRRSRKASHVGIYLKDGLFIHASTQSGVVIDRLTQDYYERMWLSGGRVTLK